MRARFHIGRLSADVVRLDEAVDRIEQLVAAGAGGSVFTPNVDHVVNAERSPALADAYARASLCLADGMPLVWVSRLRGPALPERVAGSDLAGPLLERAAALRWRVALFGGSGDAAEVAARVLVDHGVDVVAVDAPRVTAEGIAPSESLDRLRVAAPQLLLVGLGSPKQELFVDRAREVLPVTVAFACGAVIDFLAGRIPRAPEWMARAGLEWAYRLLREPRRLWRRYLVNDPAFIGIVARDWLRPAGSRQQDCS
ncbi:MAG TPA: WecB/TagA/CpsF family glycosyltransferase [Myxococcaceae bacterium]|nr:WecB/TagA/CpsF family glycosyltransferase [Myxococcaceae bacterium]